MIEIVFTKDEKGNYRGFSCHGHAGAGAYGEDIVCAAVSALTINAVNSLQLLAHAELDLETDEEEGLIRVDLASAPDASSLLLLDSLHLGLSSIQKDHADTMHIRYEEV